MTDTLWDLTQTNIKASTYLRSWRQEVFSDYGTDFKIVCHMEKITCDEEGNKLGSTDAGTIQRSLSQVITDTDVQQLNMLLMSLIQKWYLEDTQPAATPDAPQS